MKKKHFYWLDLIRFLAALTVVLTHCRGAFFVEFGLLSVQDQNVFTSLFYLLTRLGHEAVLIFFVLSGFLVGGKLITRLKDNDFNVKYYFIDRAVRIILPLISALVFITFVNFLIGTPNNWINLFGNLLSLQGIYVESVSDPFWSLPYEVWSYVFWGCVTYYIIIAKSEIKDNRLVIILIIGFCVLIFSKLKFIYLAIWGLGALSYFSFSTKSIKVLLSSSVGAFLMVVLLQLNKSSISVSHSIWRNLDRELLELLFSLFVCLFIQQVILYKPNKLFAHIDTIGTKFANFSYTLYLTHFPTIFLLRHFGFKYPADQVHLV